MAVNIPTLKELYDDVIANIESEFGINIPLFGRNFLRALAAVQAAKLKLYYLAIGNLQKNIFVDTADPESLGGTLERFGRIKLGRSPFTATPGTYAVTVTGDIGAVINEGTTFKSDDDSLNPGNLYVLDADYTLVATTDTIQLRSLDGGVEQKLEINNTLTSTSPIANVDSTATVSSEVIAPLAAETIDEYREKTIEAYQLEPQGGAGSDYRIWAADAQGVDTVFPYLKPYHHNEVEVYVQATLVDSADGKGTPTQAILDNVASVIEFDPDISKPLNERGRRPLGVFDVEVRPIVIKNIDIEIVGYQGLDTATETLIYNAIEKFISKVRPFVGSVDALANKNDIISENNLTFVVIDTVPNAVFEGINLTVQGDTLSTFTFFWGDIPYLNSVSYV